MISRFFIDRPIFATVLSVVIMLIGGIALLVLPVAQYPRITPPAIVVSISYPGASAQVVADTVGAPIEQQVNGVQGMLYMASQSGNDGSYSLTVTFDVGTDLKTALVMVQNRVALALPQLPTEVQNQGITIRKKTPDMLMIVNLYSPDGRYDDIYLSNYATIFLRDELLRVDGVSDVNYQGQRDYSIRVWLDPEKLAARSLTAADVANAIRDQNRDAPAGRLGQPPAPAGQSFQLPIGTIGRLTDPEQFGEIIVKADLGAAMRPANPVMPGGHTGLTLPIAGMTIPTATSLDGSSTPSSSGTTTSGTGVTSTTSRGASTSPTITGGGGTAAGGGTTGGGATGVTIPGLEINDDDFGNGAMGGLTMGRGPGRPSAAIVRLRDLARIELGAQNYNQACTFDGRPAMGLSVFQLPGTNALDVADRVRAKMEELKGSFPDGVAYEIAYDTTPFIRESVYDVVWTLLEAVLLVGAVVLFFLQDWKAMVLPMIDVPVSIIGTFGVMALLGFSLNNISLFGLVLAIGIVVDDAIVVLENIERQIGTGLDPRTATIKAMDEVTGPIVAVALVLCAVFVPCAFITGITGQFFRQFAVTIAVSTVISAFNAITMTPSRAVLLFKQEPGAGHIHKREALPWWIFAAAGGYLSLWLAYKLGWGPPQVAADAPRWHWWAAVAGGLTPGVLLGGLFGWFSIRPVNFVLGGLFRAFNRAFDWVTGHYGRSVGLLLRLSTIVLVVYGGLLLLTYWMFSQAPTGFIPQQDQGRLIVNIQLPDATSLERTKEIAAQVDRIARETDGVAHTVAISGLSFVLQSNSPNFASMFITLDPFDERRDPRLRDTAIMARLRKRWASEVKDAQVTVYGASPIPGLGVAGGFKFMVQDRGGLGPAALQQQTDKLVRELRQQPNLATATTLFRANTPQLFLDIDRSKAAALGVDLNDVNQTLGMFLGSRYVNSYNQFGRHWQVTVQAEGDYRNGIEDLNLFQVRNKQGQIVPLGTLVRPREIGGPISITRYNLVPAAAISGAIQPGFSTGAAIHTIDAEARETLPMSMTTDWTELMFMQLRAGNGGIYVFALAVVCVFLALAALYESWSLPLAVILVVPLCLLCSLVGVLATKREVNIFVQIGLVVLVGLACKNAILIVEFARQLQRDSRHADPDAALHWATREASQLRLRPILMTSFAFIMGVVPLVGAIGAGAEMRRSLGIAVFSGMLGVTLFGIFLTPVFFYVIQKVSTAHLFAVAAFQWIGSAVLGALLGLASGFLLSRLGVVPSKWALTLGPCLGALLVLAVLGTHQTIRRARLTIRLPGSNGGLR